MNRIFLNTKAVEKRIINKTIVDTQIIVRKRRNFVLYGMDIIFTNKISKTLAKKTIAINIIDSKDVLIQKCRMSNANIGINVKEKRKRRRVNENKVHRKQTTPKPNKR